MDEEVTHAEVEDRTTNVEEDQSDCSEVVGEGDEAEVMQDLLLVPQRRTMSQGFASLDCVNLEEVFQVRALVMKTVPMFMRGAFRTALKVGLEEMNGGHSTGNEEVSTRGWKLFLLLPRMLLYRPPRGGLIPRRRLEERVAQFNNGECVTLVESSLEHAMNGITTTARKRGRSKNDIECRTAKAFH